MRIPPEKIDEIRDATDIIDVIAQFVRLKKRGKNYVGLCPFHSEKTPSFTVSAERRLYHCFGCGAGGNVFTFVMQQEKVSFAEAVQFLAERSGISLPSPASGIQPGAEEAAAAEQDALYQTTRLAGRFYHEALVNSAEGKHALEYLHQRGFKDDAIRKFGLGYSPSGWDALLKHASANGVSSDNLVKAGLAHHREDGSCYDYFRGRLMFPIFSASGRLIAFGARKLHDDDPLGKYINSPETPIYSKSYVLYGLFQTKDAVRSADSAILVEGYADLISVFQSGVTHCVASSGTALTTGQIQLLTRYTKNIVLVYDADSSGSKATLRGVDLILENNLDVRIAELPTEEDPDSFVRNFGGDAFRKLIDDSVSFIDFKARAFQSEGKFDTPEGKTEAVRSIVQSIARIPDELKRNFYIKSVAEKYGIYEPILFRELERSTRRVDRTKEGQVGVQTLNVVDKPLYDSPLRSTVPTAERDLLKLMLENGREMVRFVLDHVSLDDFQDERTRMIVQKIIDQCEQTGALEVNTLIDGLDDEVSKSLVTNLLFSKYEVSKNWRALGIEVEEADYREIAKAALIAFQKRRIGRLIEANQSALRSATQQGHDVVPLLEAHQRLLEELKKLGSAESLKQANLNGSDHAMSSREDVD
ncbi:MAG TPA: DNA primase [Bacteroidota bacterium]